MKEVHILLVEDNEGDIILTKEAFKTGAISNSVAIAKDGEEALDYLYARNKFTGVSRPDLILLDINLPKMNGQEVLEIIKKDRELKKIPVIMLTSSSATKDILDAYSNKVDCYLIKPIDFAKFAEAVAELEIFWFSLVTVSKNKNQDKE